MIDSAVSVGMLRLHIDGALTEAAEHLLLTRMRPDLWHEFMPRQKIVKRKTVDGFISRLCLAYHYEHGGFPTESVLRRLIDSSTEDDDFVAKAHDRLDVVMRRKPEPQSLSYYFAKLEEEAKATAVLSVMVDAMHLIDLGKAGEALDMSVDALTRAQFTAGHVSELEQPMTADELMLGLLDRKYSSGILPFPYQSMTDAFGGLKRGEISIWAGKYSAGKSFVTHDIAWRLARQGYSAVIVELEMRKTTPGYRQLASMLDIPITKLERNLLNKEERRKVKAFKKAMEEELEEMESLKRITYLGTREASTVDDLEASLRARRLEPDFVLVDYITLMMPKHASNLEEHSRVGRVLQELRAFSLQRDLHVASPLHLQSSGKTQFKVVDERADVVYLLTPHEIYGPQPPNRRIGEYVGTPGILTVTATRNRTEALAKCYLEVEYSCAKVEDKPDFVEPEPVQPPKEYKKTRPQRD